jgi:hypothetical protein
VAGHSVLPECPQFDRIFLFAHNTSRREFSILPAHTRTYCRYVCGPQPPHLLLASAMRWPHPRLRLSRGVRQSRLAPRSSALQQPSDILIHDKRDARARKNPDEIRGQAAIKARYAFVCPCVRDRGWDGAMMCACQHRIVLLPPKKRFVGCVEFRITYMWDVRRCSPECGSGSLGMGMLRPTPRSSRRPT